MPSTLTITCPTCNAIVSDDDRACSRCGADLAVWSDTGRTPLVLPGNPALSQDLFRKGAGSIRRIAIGSSVGFAAVIGTWLLLREDEGPPPPAIALLAPQPQVLPDSEIIKPLPPIPTDVPRAADTVPLGQPIPSPAEMAAAGEATTAVTSAPTPAVAPNVAAPPRVAVLPPPPTPQRPVPTPPPLTRTPIAAGASSVAARPTTPAPVATRTPAPTPPPAAPAVTPVLRLSPLVSDSMRTGELLQIRWTVQDRNSGRPVSTPVEFTSTNAAVATVDRVKGTVSARAPGRVQIIADGGTAGRFAITLAVRSPSRLAVSTVPAETLQIRTESARSLSGANAPTRVSAPIVSAPAPAAIAAPLRDAPRIDQLDAEDVRIAVNRFLTQVRNGDTSNPSLVEFLADGASHRVNLVSPPATISASASVVRVTFEMRLTKFDGGGRPVTRIAPVSMDVEKRQGDVSTSDIAVSALRRP